VTVAPPQETVPVETDPDGVVRVGGTRIPLETVISAFDAGATPETICEDFPSLELDDVYAVVTYALRHRDEVDRYLARRRALADEARQEVEALPGNRRLRVRLLARRRS
jgi:uncharacterized protein (DUF433 family)